MAIIPGWKQLGKASAALASGAFLASAISLVATVIAARYLSVFEFGRLAIIVTCVQLVDRFCSFQTWQALVRFFGNRSLSGHVSDRAYHLFAIGFRYDVAAASVAALSCGATLTVIGVGFNWDVELIYAAIGYAAVLIVRLPGFPGAILRLSESYIFIGAPGLAGAIVRLVGAVCGDYMDADLRYYVCIWLSADLISSLVLQVSAFVIARRVRLKFSKLARTVLSNPKPNASIREYVWSSSLHSSVRGGAKEIDVVLAGVLLGEAASALYRAVKQVGNAFSMALDPLFQVLFPKFSVMRATRQVGEAFAITKIASLFIGISFLFVLPIIIYFAPRFLGFVYGPGYAAASGLLSIYVAAMLFANSASPLTAFNYAFGKAYPVFLANAIAAAVYLPTSIMLGAWYGVEGIAFATVIYYSLAFVLLYSQALKLVRKS